MNKKIQWVVGIIIAISFLILIFYIIPSIIENGNEQEKYGDCLQDFANDYCKSINYSRADYWGSGIAPYQYFKCASERDYRGFGEFVATEEEKEYCREISFKEENN